MRPLARRAVGWAFLADLVPLYALYALLFADTGLSDAEISALFAIWSAVGLVCEVPAGALADRSSRRAALAASGVAQSAGFAAWLVAPGFAGFAAGFVLWGVGGSLASGAFEALLYDALAHHGARRHYASLLGRTRAAGLLAQLPAAAVAAGLFAVGGFGLVGWVSVAVPLLGSALALALPEHRSAMPQRIRDTVPDHDGEATTDDDLGYSALLRAGVLEAVTQPALFTAVTAVAVLTAVDGLEEYFPLIAEGLGVPTAWNPLAVAVIPLAGAAGALLAASVDPAGQWRRGGVTGAGLAVAAGLLALVQVVDRPAALGLVASFYALYRFVLVIVDTALQERITGPRRATITSVAGLLTEIAGVGLFGIWALGGLPAVTVSVALVAALLPVLLRRTSSGSRDE